MVGFEIFGISLVIISIILAFYKKKDKVAMALIITLLALLWILNSYGKLFS